jgi:hypothetical protein
MIETEKMFVYFLFCCGFFKKLVNTYETKLSRFTDLYKNEKFLTTKHENKLHLHEK